MRRNLSKTFLEKKKVLSDEVIKICDKLLKNEALKKQEIVKFTEYYFLDTEKQKFVSFCELEHIKNQLKMNDSDSFTSDYLFFVLFSKENVEAFITLTKQDELSMFYTNFNLSGHNETIINLIKGIFSITTVNIKSLDNYNILQKHRQDILIITLLKCFTDKALNSNVNEFIDSFNKFENFILNLKDKSSKDLMKDIYQIYRYDYSRAIDFDIKQISSDLEFKNALKLFTNNLPVVKDFECFDEYQKTLKEFVDHNEGFPAVNDSSVDLTNQLVQRKKKLISQTQSVNLESLKKIENFPKQIEILKRFF